MIPDRLGYARARCDVLGMTVCSGHIGERITGQPLQDVDVQLKSAVESPALA